MAAVRISVGASSDGSMKTVFRPMVEAAKQARAQIAAEFEGLKGQLGATFQAVPGLAATAFAGVTEAEKQELQRQIEAVRATEAAKKKLRQESGGGTGGRGRHEGSGGGRDNGYRTALATKNYFNESIRGAGRTAMGVARGVGVDMDLGSLVNKSVQMRKMAEDLASAGWQPEGNDPAAKVRQDPAALMREARAAGNKAGLDPLQAISGMANFVSTTGDLKGAREIIGDLGVLARATGTEFDDMVTAAGEVSAKLGDIPNKGPMILSIMRTLAGQGKIGAIEIKQMAVEMAKVGSAAKAFNMAPDKAMQMMGAIMQEARQQGGAKSASVAANAAMALVQTLTKKATLKNLQAQGVQPFADPGKDTQLLSPETIIMAAIHKSKGSQRVLASMFKDTMAYRAVRGFATTYNDAKGTHEDKMGAVRGEFTRLKKAQMSQGEVATQFAASMKGDEAKIQLFNNRLSEIGAEVGGKLLPALGQLAPYVVSAVEAFGKFVAWAAENPGKAVAAALVASFARAGLDTVLRAGVERLFDRATGKGGAGGGGGLGPLGSALAITATAITIAQVGQLIIDKVMDDKGKDATNKANEDAMRLNAEGAMRRAREHRATPEDVKTLANQTNAARGRLQRAEEAQGEGFWQVAGRTITGENGGLGGYIDASKDAENLPQLYQEYGKLAAQLEAAQRDAGKNMASALAQGGPLKVVVVGGGVTVDPAGRSPGKAP